jgi:hypothetical protein
MEEPVAVSVGLRAAEPSPPCALCALEFACPEWHLPGLSDVSCRVHATAGNRKPLDSPQSLSLGHAAARRMKIVRIAGPRVSG